MSILTKFSKILSEEENMKTVKMKIAGISINDGLMNPLIILKSFKGEIFPVSLENFDRKTLFNSIIMKNSIHSELVSKLLSLTGINIKKIILDRSGKNKLISRIYTDRKKEASLEMSAAAGLLLCIETGLDVTVNSELFKEASFFKNKIDEKKIFEDLDKFFINEPGFDQSSKASNPVKEIVQ
jgi:hypothetical protein